MLKTVLIDDERPALKALEYVLKQFDRIEIIGMFTDVAEAFETIRSQDVHLVFLDIEMPSMKGIEAASILFEIKKDIDIVFVTAFDDYALRAFEIAAVDYLLKPVTRGRMAKTLRRIRERDGIEREASGSEGGMVSCFGGFEVKKAGGTGGEITWSASKVKELFAYLMSRHGGQVKKEMIMEDLWPEMAYDRALVNLNTCIYQLRRVIANAKLDIEVTYRSGCYIMKPGKVSLDSDKFAGLMSDIKKAAEPEQGKIRELTGLYQGGYLKNEQYSWAMPKQQSYYRQYKEAVLYYAACCLKKAMYNAAIEGAEELLQYDEFCEEAWEILIGAHIGKGNKAVALKSFERYEHILRKELGIGANIRIKELLEDLN